MNCVILEGRLTRDIEVNASGKVGNTSIAVDRAFPFNKDSEGNKVSDFIRIRFIGESNVSRASQYLHKGTKICLRGDWWHESWQKDGETRSMDLCHVQDWEFSESKSVSSGEYQTSNSNSARSNTSNYDAFMEVDDDDDAGIPFA